MPQSKGLWSLVAAASVGFSVSAVSAQTDTVCGNSGPDVIVGEITGGSNVIAPSSTFNVTATATHDAFSIGTYSCNIGDFRLQWLTASNTGNPTENRHPVIGQNLYKTKMVTTAEGSYRTFEQLGQSWLKHGFTALQNTLCCPTCTSSGTGSYLGIGCGDPYTASRNAGQSSLGPKWQVNAATGVFTYPPANPAGGSSSSVARRLAVRLADLDTTSTYYVEAQYVAQDDATNGNQDNNCSYRPVSMTGTPTNYTATLTGTTVRETPAIHAWKVLDPTVTETDLKIPADGLMIVSSKATELSGGVWHYEYAVFNMNSDRSAGAFSVPVPDSATVTNIGFRDVDYRDGDGIANVNIDGTDWSSSRSNGRLTWSTTPFATNANGNAIRWGTMYNFRFDANVAPDLAGEATVSTWKTAGDYVVLAQVPAAGEPPCYANCDGSTNEPALNVLDFNCFLNAFNAGASYANCDGSTNAPILTVLDFNCFLNAFNAGCN